MKRKYESRIERINLLKFLLISISLALLIRTFVINSTIIDGNSMYPTLQNGERLLVNNVAYIFGHPKRGDVISLKAPDAESENYVKRVVGLPGDKVVIESGKVYLNGKEYVENYEKTGTYTESDNGKSWVISEDEIFVLGDNREPYASKDSRTLGPIDIRKLRGKVFFRYYPFSRKGILK